MRAVAAVFREHRGGLEVLLVKSSSGRHFVLPGGKCESGETQVAAARRETLEEAGLRVVGFGERSGGFAWKGDWTEVVVFKGAYPAGEAERETKWFPLEAAVRLLRLGRSPVEADPLVVALWGAVDRYRGVGGEQKAVAAGNSPGK